MTENKRPKDFIKQFKGIFEKVITVPVNNEKEYIAPKKTRVILPMRWVSIQKKVKIIKKL